MRKRFRKLTAVILTTIITLSGLVFSSVSVEATQDRTYNFYTNYNLTGNPVDDIVNVAMAQQNRTKASMGYTEAWCADFVGDCADLAGLSYAIPRAGYCGTLWDNIIDSGGYEVSSPQKGDIIFYYCTASYCPNSGKPWVHVGIMTSSSSSIEGNSGGKVTAKSTITYTDTNGHTYGHAGSNSVIVKYLRPKYKDEPVYDDPEVDNWFYHGATDHSDFRPVISIKNPETVSSVKFAVRYDTTDWKWYNGEFNGGNAWYCDVLSSDIGVGNYILCHAYVYGKNGSYNGYPFTELTLGKDAEPSVQTWYYDGATDHSDFRPVIRFDNPETVASVKFAVKYDTGDWKWYEGEYNGGNAWYCDILSDDLGSGNHIVCHGYVYAKNGSYKGYPFVELKLDKDYDDPSINKWEYSFNDEEKEINYIIGFDNPETVSNVRFAIRTDQSDWEWFDGKQNEDNTWNYSIKYNNYNIGESIYCHCYVRGRNGFYNGYPYPNIEIKSKCELGDTNLDGIISVSDVTAIQRYLVELETFNDEQITLADTNGDGSVDITDATHLQMFLAEYDGIVLGKS